ncbi:MAG: 2-oxo acid dehydrogenase subunit E2 [Candidatus Eremiobacteraeota bacterium]|nr:2-oxo acid dehydrogenase subunit E2 [Candidatus Eremiobacteraeota bacterium]
MPTTITMPQLGETVTEGTVAQWLKKPGDNVEKYESFVEVSTDKVNAEVPSPVTGRLSQLLVKEGETVATGTPIAVIDEGEALTEGSAAAQTQPQREDRSAPPAETAPERTPMPAASAGNGAMRDGAAALRGASPAVRRLAREHHIDISTLRGTGQNGRVTVDDVMAAARMGPAAAVGQAVASAAPPPAMQAPAAQAPPAARASTTQAPAAHPETTETSTYAAPRPGTIIPLNQARRIIAQRMVESKQTAPHAWSMVEVDVTNLWKWRQREKEAFQRDHGYSLTLLPFFIRAVIESIGAFPLMNARFTDDGIYVHPDVNIGIAIGLPTNLVVPVIKHADKLSIRGLAIVAGQLIEKARNNKLNVDDLAGGTFTVNNNGANGSYASAPIINGGQAGIVTMEAVVRKPVVLRDDAIAIRSMMNCCLSLDHRVVDGYVASGYLADLKKRLEAMGPDGSL